MLGTIFICYFFGFKIAAFLSVYLNKVIHTNPSTMHMISTFVAWMGLSIGIYFLAKLLTKLVNVTPLGFINKISGAIFGLIKYALLISLALYFLNKINFDNKWLNADAKAKSVLYYKVLGISGWVL
jgi:membrane protein required for colicin V production